MSESFFDGTQRTPLDINAGRVFSSGVKAPQVFVANHAYHWEVCPPILPFQKTWNENLAGKKVGRFTVIGMHRDIKARWVVRCSCGFFEVRTAKAIKNPNNNEDRCLECRHLVESKKRHHYFSTGRNLS